MIGRCNSFSGLIVFLLVSFDVRRLGRGVGING